MRSNRNIIFQRPAIICFWRYFVKAHYFLKTIYFLSLSNSEDLRYFWKLNLAWSQYINLSESNKLCVIKKKNEKKIVWFITWLFFNPIYHVQCLVQFFKKKNKKKKLSNPFFVIWIHLCIQQRSIFQHLLERALGTWASYIDLYQSKRHQTGNRIVLNHLRIFEYPFNSISCFSTQRTLVFGNISLRLWILWDRLEDWTGDRVEGWDYGNSPGVIISLSLSLSFSRFQTRGLLFKTRPKPVTVNLNLTSLRIWLSTKGSSLSYVTWTSTLIYCYYNLVQY